MKAKLTAVEVLLLLGLQGPLCGPEPTKPSVWSRVVDDSGYQEMEFGAYKSFCCFSLMEVREQV